MTSAFKVLLKLLQFFQILFLDLRILYFYYVQVLLVHFSLLSESLSKVIGFLSEELLSIISVNFRGVNNSI